MRDASSDLLQTEKSPRAMNSSSGGGTAARWCPEFRPSRAEFASFATYIRTVVEPQCADIGVCKVYQLVVLPAFSRPLLIVWLCCGRCRSFHHVGGSREPTRRWIAS